MATDRPPLLAVPAAAALLLWPALWNGYPIVFADTGTYLSQAIQHYAGWDRPVFYSLFMLPLHATVTVWPVVVVQALLAAWVLWRVCRALVPDVSPIAFVAGLAALAVCTWLPWIVSELMPDLFTPLLILVLCLLAWIPERLSSREQIALVGSAAFMIASQQSSLPLACVLGLVLGLVRSVGAGTAQASPAVARDSSAAAKAIPSTAGTVPCVPGTVRFMAGTAWLPSRVFRPVSWKAGHPRSAMVATSKAWVAEPPHARVLAGPAMTRGEDPAIHCSRSALVGKVPTLAIRPPRPWLLAVVPPALAILGLCTVNLAAHGRFAVSPFGNVFLLARVIYDGPGMSVLTRDCPTANWRLCPFLDSFPPTSDDFLWTPGSPLNRAGGPKAVSQDAGAIIEAALLADPAGEVRAGLANTLEQMTRFDSGDGLKPWPAQVSPWIARDFPVREQAAYASARQQAGILSVPPLLRYLHTLTAVGGVLGCAMLLPVAIRRRAACAGFLLAVLLALPLSAAITGGLSAPHDRYQARIMWLPPFIAALSFASLRRQPR